MDHSNLNYDECMDYYDCSSWVIHCLAHTGIKTIPNTGALGLYDVYCVFFTQMLLIAICFEKMIWRISIVIFAYLFSFFNFIKYKKLKEKCCKIFNFML